MAYFVHYLVSLSLRFKCSQFSFLYVVKLWHSFRVHLCTWIQPGMAPVVRVEPYEMTLLDSNPELLSQVEDVGWLPFVKNFSDSNPEVTRVLLSL